MAKKILITGASGGFGKRTVLTLLKNGHQVAASMRNLQGKNQAVAKELQQAGALVLEIDVTHDLSASEGVQLALEELGGLDVLINNAGLGVLGMQEFLHPPTFKKYSTSMYLGFNV